MHSFKRDDQRKKTTILEDLKYLNMENIKFEEIKNMKKGVFKKLVKQKIKGETFENLHKRKFSHSKVKHVEHNGLIMQKYLKPNKSKMSKEEAQLVFKLRCRVTETKVNLKRKYDNLECETCGLKKKPAAHISMYRTK